MTYMKKISVPLIGDFVFNGYMINIHAYHMISVPLIGDFVFNFLQQINIGVINGLYFRPLNRGFCF